MKFVIGSLNKAKVKAAKNVLMNCFPDAYMCEVNVPSQVSPQPIGDEETLQGAMNRAKNAVVKHPQAIGIGLEGGVRSIHNKMYVCNWGALYLNNGRFITAGGAQILLPQEVAERIEAGEELGDAMDYFFLQKSIRHEKGAIGMFTDGHVTRIDLFTHIMELLIGQYKFMINNTNLF